MENSFFPEAEHYVKDNIAILPTGCILRNSGKCFSVIPEELTPGQVIGIGCSSHVIKSFHKPSGTSLALKTIKMYDKTKREQLYRELCILSEFAHPCIIRFYGAFYRNSAVTLALEYMDGGSLQNVIYQLGTVSESMLANMAYQILHGLAYLKEKKRIHRDIKPSNILLNSKGEVKVTDFGLSAELRNSLAMCGTFVGTFKYMSPERIQKHPYTYSSDLWSLGLVLIECATGGYPYKTTSSSYIELIQSILESPSPSLSIEYFSKEFCHFITSCLQKNPLTRPSYDELLDSQWFKICSISSIQRAQTDLYRWIANG